MSVAKQDLIDKLADIVAGIAYTVTINSIANPSTDVYTLSVCDVGYAQVGRVVDIGGDDYTITAVDFDLLTITVTGATDPTGTTEFDLYGISFFYGTPYAVNNELTEVPNSDNKTPMIFMAFPFTENFHDDPEDIIDREADVSLYFLTSTVKGFDLSTTSDFHTEGLKPMKRLQQLFFEALRDDTDFDTDELEIKTSNYTKFGVYVNQKGIENGIFVDQLTGTGADVNLKLYKDLMCHDC